MSSEEEDALMENIERKWNAKNRDAFMHRMERKLNRKARFNNHD